MDFKGEIKENNISGTYVVRGQTVNGTFSLTREF